MIKDIHNIGGRHLKGDDLIYVLSERLKEIKVKNFKIVKLKNMKQSEIQFSCSECNEENIRKSSQLLNYKINICKKCSNKNKGLHRRINENKNTLQSKIDKAYEDREFSFKVIEDFIYNNNKQEVKTQCSKCNKVYMTRIDLLKQGRKSCVCSYTKSKLETKVQDILVKNNIDFSREYSFSDLRNIQPLRFDFMVNVDGVKKMIECDGIQHYYPTFGEISFERTKLTDEIKNKYCIDNDIELLRIKYNKLENLEKIIIDFTK